MNSLEGKMGSKPRTPRSYIDDTGLKFDLPMYRRTRCRRCGLSLRYGPFLTSLKAFMFQSLQFAPMSFSLARCSVLRVAISTAQVRDGACASTVDTWCRRSRFLEQIAHSTNHHARNHARHRLGSSAPTADRHR